MITETKQKVNCPMEMRAEVLDFEFLKRWEKCKRKKAAILYIFLVIPTILFLNSLSYGALIQISSIEDLQKIGNDPNYPLDNDYELTQNIDASDTVNWNSGAGFIPIGTSTNFFTGKFDGKGYKITGLYINRPSTYEVALFGAISHSSQLVNLCIENCQIVSNSETGALLGRNLGGTVSNCYSSGSLEGNYAIGGLVGWNQGGMVSNCYSTSSVQGLGCIGGLIGENWDTVLNCYSTGSVSGTEETVGGLVGRNVGGTISNCYWDVQTSGRSSSAGGTGKTTIEMKQQATYAGWNFTSIWWINEGVSYPYLRTIWQIVPNVVGMLQSNAEGMIRASGLTVGTISEQCTTVSAGKVISQSPTSGQQVLSGTAVALVISTGLCPEGEGTVEGTHEGTVEGSISEGGREGEGTIEGTHEGTVEGSTTEGVREGEGETDRCGCRGCNNKSLGEEEWRKYLLDFVLLGLLISLISGMEKVQKRKL